MSAEDKVLEAAVALHSRHMRPAGYRSSARQTRILPESARALVDVVSWVRAQDQLIRIIIPSLLKNSN